MRLQHLHLLLTLAQTGSLRASAEALNVTQPALTKALKQLEEEFGTTLVVRTPKGVRLAPAGELLAARAATVVRELERAREEVAWHTQNTQASVSVGVSPAAALMLTANAVARFQTRWPEVRVRLVDALYPKALQQLRSGEVDLALGPLPVSGLGQDLHARPLIHSPTVIVARKGHALRGARSLKDLQSAHWLLSGPRMGPGDPTHLGFEQRGLTPPVVTMECESFSTLLAVLPEMDVLAAVPKRFFDTHGPRIGLTVLDLEETLPPTTIHLFTRTDTPLTLPTRRLVDAFIHEANTLQQRMAMTQSGDD
jgi:LysR family transcriptional regulator of abg operon